MHQQEDVVFVADMKVADAEVDEVVIELDGVSVVDQQDDELDLANRDGASCMVCGLEPGE